MSDVAELIARPDTDSCETSKPHRTTSGARYPRFVIAFALAVVAIGLMWLQARKTEDRWRLPEDLTSYRAISRIEDFLYSNESADCVLLGSSLMQGPAHQMDIVFEDLKVPPKERDASEAMKTFTKSKHLKKVFEHSSKNYSPISLSVVSSSVADNAEITRQLINFKKTPKLIIVGVGLRDLCSEIHDSPVRNRLRALQPESKWVCDPIAGITAKIELSKSVRSLKRQWLEVCWQLHVCKTYIAKKLWLLSPVTTNRSWKKQNYFKAPKEHADTSKGSANESQDHANAARTSMMLRNYQRYYTLAKNESVIAQGDQLRYLVKSATDNGAKVIVVLMPVSPEHMTAIPPRLTTLFRDSITRLKADFPVVIADQFSNADYSESDFGDSIHLTGAAMDKLFHRLLPDVPPAK